MCQVAAEHTVSCVHLCTIASDESGWSLVVTGFHVVCVIEVLGVQKPSGLPLQVLLGRPGWSARRVPSSLGHLLSHCLDIMNELGSTQLRRVHMPDLNSSRVNCPVV